MRRARALPVEDSPKPAKKKATKKKATKAPKKKATKATPKEKPLKAAKGKPKADATATVEASAEAYAAHLEESFTMFGDPTATVRMPSERVSTGVLALDRFTGGGWPVGMIAEVAAWEGVGKSTLVDQSIAYAQSLGVITALVDTERGRDETYMRRLGINPGRLLLSRAHTLEEGFTACERLLEVHAKAMTKGTPPLLLFWDSVGGTPSRVELEGEADDSHVGVHARAIRQNFRRLTQNIADLRCAFVFTNHFYQTIGPQSRLVSSGGGGIRYFTSLRLWLKFKQKLQSGGVDVGHIVDASLKKTRIVSPQPPIELGLLFGAGFDNGWTLFEWCKENKRIEQRGSWCYFKHPLRDGESVQFQRAFLGFGQLLASDPELYQALVEEYRGT